MAFTVTTTNGAHRTRRTCTTTAARREALTLAIIAGTYDAAFAPVLAWDGRSSATFPGVAIEREAA